VATAAVAVCALTVGIVSHTAGHRNAERSVADSQLAEGVAEARAAALRSEVAVRDTVLSAMTEGVVLFAPEGDVAYANPAARAILGRRFASSHEVTPVALRDAVFAAAGTQDVGGERSAPEASVRQFETVRGVVEATVVPSSPPGTVVLVARDVTEARRLERLRRDFVANASHELKTPVASIQAIAETLQHAASEDPEATERFLALLEQEATRLARLVRDLLELSRLEGDAGEPAPLRIDRVVRTETERLRPRAEAAGLSFAPVAVEPAEVLGSEADLALLVHNLVDNAIRYTPAGGQIRVALFARDGRAVIEVDDTGIGIPSSSLDRVFERFYRVDAARSRETGGTGLGLSIVRHVAESHGGDVRVESVLGSGSTFMVRLPLIGAARARLRTAGGHATVSATGPGQLAVEPAGSTSSLT
jgi:signal transduction histidine kinase